MEKINKMDINKIEEKYYRNITNNDISQKKYSKDVTDRGYIKKNPELARRDNNKYYQKNKQKIQRKKAIKRLKDGFNVRKDTLIKLNIYTGQIIFESENPTEIWDNLNDSEKNIYETRAYEYNKNINESL